MEAKLSCGVPRTLNKTWDRMSQPKTRGEAAYQELSDKAGKKDTESVSTGGLLPNKDPL